MVLVGTVLSVSACDRKPGVAVVQFNMQKPAPKTMPTWDTTKVKEGSEGIKYIVLRAGNGTRPAAGQTVDVQYSGWLEGGRLFDSSVDRNQKFTFVLARGQVIRGWDLAVADMLPGEIRRVRIPPHIAYGTRGAGAGIIPPNATLVFDIELLGSR